MLIKKNLRCIKDARGFLTVLQDEVPFMIKRVYWIHGNSISKRGGHRHHNARQLLIAIQGTIVVRVVKHSIETNIQLESSGDFVLVEPTDWHEMTFSDDGILLVVASHDFDPDDYIEDPLP
jgi:WxcM-like, C-terminal